MPTAEFSERMETLIDEIHAAPLADGASPLRVPGEFEWEHQDKAMKEKISRPEDGVANLKLAAEMTGVTLNQV